MTENKKIGFIGLGTMGHGMVQNLLKNNFFVNGYNRTKAKAQDIKDKNFIILNAPSQVTKESDVIITCVANDEAIKDVLFSKNGVFEEITEEKILIDCSTTSIEMTSKISEKCKKMNVKFLDAPITGSKMGAESGRLLFMAGGNKKKLEECMQIFNAMGTKTVYCGENTYGQRAKIALNLSQALVLQGYLEGMMLGVKNGVPLQSMLEIFDNSGAKSNVSSVKMPKIMKRDFEPHFKLGLMNKDITFAVHEMKKLGLEFELTKSIGKIFQKAMKKGLENDDIAGIVKLLEEDAGIVLKE